MKLVTAIALFATAGPLAAASLYLETYSTDNDTSGWFQVSNGSSDTLAQSPPSDFLEITAADFTSLYAVADASASTGAFVGDLVAASISAFKFELSIFGGSTVTNLFFELSNINNGETWAYNLSLPAFDTPTVFTVPLGGPGWTQSSGSQPFSYILANTEEVAIGFGSTGSGTFVATIDNVESIPEPTSLTLMGIAALAAGIRRRRNG